MSRASNPFAASHADTPPTPTPRRYTAVDGAMMLYLLLVFAAVILLGDDLPRRVEILGVHLGFFIFVRIGVPWLRQSGNAVAVFLADCYPLALFSFLYPYANLANTIFFDTRFDDVLRDWDHRLFGVQPSHWLHDTFGNRIVDEIVSAGYASYYALAPVVAFSLRALCPRATFRRFMFTMTLTFLVSYAAFIAFPAWGPQLERGTDYHGFVFVPFLDFIYRHAETGGGAFPSSHVAVALVCMTYARRHLPRLFRAWLIPALLLVFGTVYCRYHYAVDAIAGIAWGAILLWTGDRLHRALSR